MTKLGEEEIDVSPVQVPPEHYEFESYDNRERWASYWHQIHGALALKPSSVLSIGTGNSVFESYLRNRDIAVATVDIDETRRPDYLADVSKLDQQLPAGLHFDVVAAFQVLEHVPFELFEDCLASIAKRGKHALISLPSWGWTLRGAVGLGGLKLAWGIYPRYPFPRAFNAQHHWELGPKYKVRMVTRVMATYFDVLENYRIPENPYQVMWVLRSKLSKA